MNEVLGSGGEVTIRAAGFAPLLFAHERGDELVDLTDPSRPRLREAGTYSFALTAECWSSPFAQGQALLIVGLGSFYGADGVSVDQGFSLGTFPTPRASGSLTWEVEAGAEVGAVVWNFAIDALAFRPIMGLLQKL